jgi:3-hydroxyacyl-CoA dehydrogenase / enoyl-CoA hydratase / 3-hydroxybutyryl-CoA epimerase
MTQSYQHWTLEFDDEGIIWLHSDMSGSSVNVLSEPVLNELDDILHIVENESPIGLVILSDKHLGFIAGADAKAFDKIEDYHNALELIRRGQAILSRIASLPCPSVALIHGFCFGGGLELALACHYRVAQDDTATRLGLPEIKLGIHPGFGGTVRLPALVGELTALDMMITGRSLSVKAAKKCRLVDDVVPRYQMNRAARHIIFDLPKRSRPSWFKTLPGYRLLRPLFAKALRAKVSRKVSPKHYPAPYALIDIWQQYRNDTRIMLRQEAESVARLITGDTSRNLVRVFFLQEQLKALGNRNDFQPYHVHVIGAGVMGCDIATWCAIQGFKVTLQDRSHTVLANAVKRAHLMIGRRFKDKFLTQEAMDRFIPDSPGYGLKKANVIIEAIIENLEAKQHLYQQIEPLIQPEAILATNTSSIPLEELASVLQQPQRLVGLHFFNPVHKMQLIEVVAQPHTDPHITQSATAFARHIGRLPVIVKSTPGFLINRVLMPYLFEAALLADEGIPITTIDRIATEFGMPMGPIELADTVGLDICLSVAENLSRYLTNITIPENLKRLVNDKRLGKKTGHGFYRYEKGRIKRESQVAYQPTLDTTDRLMLRLLNETVNCLREGVVERAELLDAAVIFGTGFAPFYGGPLNYCDTAGREKIKQRLQELANEFGERFTPDAGW